MPTPIETVQAFLAECFRSRSSMEHYFNTYFTPTSVWENVGLARTTGPDEALALMDGFESTMGAVALDIETLTIAAHGNRVLTERIDHMLKADGSEASALRVMGIFEVEGDKIVAWRDYFDTAGLMASIQAK